MKITLDFKDEEEFEVFRDMLGHGMIEMVNNCGRAEDYFKAQNVFEVYTRAFKEMVKNE